MPPLHSAVRPVPSIWATTSPFTGRRIDDDAAAVRQFVASSVLGFAAARSPLEPALPEPSCEIEALIVLPVWMNPHFVRRRRAEQVHGEGHHDRTLGQVVLVLPGVLADPIRGRSKLADQILEIHVYPAFGRTGCIAARISSRYNR
jgi:hypothetical protein